MAYAGFDKLAYPGDALMAWLKADTNLSFVGFYLAPAPSRPTSDWMGRRGTLAAQGWGFAPVYVGQQEATQPGQHVLTAPQGAIDAQDAVSLMNVEAFPRGSVVYLDIEQGGAESAATQAYSCAWIDAVNADGSYHPAVYCSHTTAPSLLALRPGTQLWVWNIAGAVPGPNYPPNLPANNPSVSGVPSATVLQYAQNVSIDLHNGPTAKLGLDLDCASIPDPSLPSGM
jgi:hypothetical protein